MFYQDIAHAYSKARHLPYLYPTTEVTSNVPMQPTRISERSESPFFLFFPPLPALPCYCSCWWLHTREPLV